MESLRIPIVSVPEPGLAISVGFVQEDVQPADTAPLALVKGSLEGMLSEVGGEYLFSGRLLASWLHACDRCLEDAHAEGETEVMWHFASGASEGVHVWDGDNDVEFEYAETGEDPEWTQPIVHGVIDLAPAVWEELVIAAPSKYTCREDCKGLCNRCGANLNEGACACGPEDTKKQSGHQGFAKLADLYPVLMNKPTEE
jgi:uncharacterized metal-binding protein YceD (DUF177 family)